MHPSQPLTWRRPQRDLFGLLAPLQRRVHPGAVPESVPRDWPKAPNKKATPRRAGSLGCNDDRQFCNARTPQIPQRLALSSPLAVGIPHSGHDVAKISQPDLSREGARDTSLLGNTSLHTF